MKAAMIEVHFYEEKVLIPLCDSLETFHRLISEKFSLDPADSSELIIYFTCGAIKCYVNGEDAFKMAISQLLDPTNKNTLMVFELEVSEKSRLFQTELVNINSQEYFTNTFVIVENEKTKEKEYQEKQELLQKQEKEKERERKELEKYEKVRLQKAQELAQQIAKDKEELTKSVSKAVIETLNSNLEKFKEQLIEKALQETSKAIEKSVLLRKSTISKNETVHNGYSCDACGMKPIVGNRYHCTVCYNFDLCDSCEEQCTHPHGLIKYKTESMCPNFQNKHFPKNIMQAVKDLRDQYDLSSFTDDQIKSALIKTFGNPDEALEMLFK